MNKFDSIGLTYLAANEGELREFSPANVELGRGVVSSDPKFHSADINLVLFETMFAKMWGKEPFGEFDLSWCGLFHFRPETGFEEEDGSAKYQIFQLPLNRGRDNVYVVLDELKPGTDMVRERLRQTITYRLRGISFPNPVPVLENAWANRDESWFFWSTEPRDFNRGVFS